MLPTKDGFMLTILPGFTGFYDSIHSDCVERLAGYGDDDFYEVKNDEKKTQELEERMQAYDFRSAYQKYAKEFVKVWSTMADVPLEFESLQSPRFYNFTTDRIFCWIDVATVQKMHAAIAEKECFKKFLAKIVEENFTSRSGFSSFYSNDLATWLEKPLEDWDHNEIETLIAAHICFNANENEERLRELNDEACTELWQDGTALEE